jgi:hypothetical protein
MKDLSTTLPSNPFFLALFGKKKKHTWLEKKEEERKVLEKGGLPCVLKLFAIRKLPLSMSAREILRVV